MQKQAMINLGVLEAVAEDGAKAFILFAERGAGYISDDVPLILGRPPRSLEQFAADCAAAFP